MYAAKGTQAYAQIGVESAVMSASQQQLVTMLFDGVLSALVRARLFMQDNNQQGKGVSLSKAINIIENGLRVSLDEESKDELTQNLIALYSYMVRRLLQANLRNDVSAVEEVEALMRNIADAWKESLLSPSLIQDTSLMNMHRICISPGNNSSKKASSCYAWQQKNSGTNSSPAKWRM